MRCQPGVSLVEVVLAVVILGLLAALTIPRLSTAATPPDEGALLREHLKVMRVAIERYYQDHGVYPGALGHGQTAAGEPTTVIAQLTRYTDADGHVSDVRDARHRFGPYLRDGVPPCPVPPRIGRTGLCILAGDERPDFAPDAPDAGWLYNPRTGRIAVNSDVVSPDGRGYISY